MRRVKNIFVLAIVIVVLLLGTVVAEGGWWWNSTIDVEGTEIHTVWQVDDIDGANDYQASIKVLVPSGVDASIRTEADTETVRLIKTSRMTCEPGSGTVEAEVWYKIKALKDSNGTHAFLRVELVDGSVLAADTVTVGGGFARLDVDIPVTGPTCE